MGSETILPGTPLSDIPLQDQPNFSATLQNGFTGSPALPATPASATGTGVITQRFQFSLRNLTPSTVQPAFALFQGGDWRTISWSGVVAAGATVTLSSLNFGGGAEPQGPAFVEIQAPGSVTTGSVFLSSKDGTGTDSVDVGAISRAGGILRLRVENAQGYYSVHNTDAAAQTVRVIISPDPEAAIFNRARWTYDLGPAGLNLGLTVNPNDVYRIRAVALSLYGLGGPNSDNTLKFGSAYLAIRTRNPGTSLNSAPPLVARLERGETDWFQGNPLDAGAGTAGIVYHLETPLVILGTDANVPAQPYAPFMQILADVANFSRAQLNVTPDGWLLLDYWQGVNT